MTTLYLQASHHSISFAALVEKISKALEFTKPENLGPWTYK